MGKLHPKTPGRPLWAAPRWVYYFTLGVMPWFMQLIGVPDTPAAQLQLIQKMRNADATANQLSYTNYCSPGFDPIKTYGYYDTPLCEYTIYDMSPAKDLVYSIAINVGSLDTAVQIIGLIFLLLAWAIISRPIWILINDQ